MAENQSSSSSFCIQTGEVWEKPVDSTGRLTFSKDYAGTSFQVAILTEKESGELEVSEVLEVEADERGRINISEEYGGKTVYIAECEEDGDSLQ